MDLEGHAQKGPQFTETARYHALEAPPWVLTYADLYLGLRLGLSSLWVALRELIFRYHNPETMLFTINPEYGDSHLN